MPWKRRNNCEYFYRSRRVGGRVVQEYLGAGGAAILCAALVQGDEQERREQWAQDRESRRDDRAWQRGQERRLDAVLRLAAEAMEAAGYHRPDRHRWRKRRGMTTMAATTEQLPARARPGVPSRMPAPPLGERLDEVALDALSTRYVGDGEAFASHRGKLEADVRRVAVELAGPDPPPLVAMMAGAVALAWAETRLAQTVEHEHAARGEHRADAELRGRRTDRAHRRFLRGARELAALRRVDPKVLIQVNQHFGDASDGQLDR